MPRLRTSFGEEMLASLKGEDGGKKQGNHIQGHLERLVPIQRLLLTVRDKVLCELTGGSGRG